MMTGEGEDRQEEDPGLMTDLPGMGGETVDHQDKLRDQIFQMKENFKEIKDHQETRQDQ